MSNRQKIYIALAASAGVCTGVGLFLYFRYLRQKNSSRTSNSIDRSSGVSSIISSLRHRRGDRYTDITTTDDNDDETNLPSIRFESGDGSTQFDISGNSTSLSLEQATMLVRYLDETYSNDEGRFQSVLTTIANLGTFAENQLNLTNAGCIERLREYLSASNNDDTKYKILIALNNLALNEYAITRFSNFVPVVIKLCRTASPQSKIRLYGLNLLVNMSVLEHLHKEFIEEIPELDALIRSTWNSPDEALAIGKMLVNLSTNKFNVVELLKLNSIDLKTIVNSCTPVKNAAGQEIATKLEEILLRYVGFYCHVSEIVVAELNKFPEDAVINKSYLINPVPHGQNSVYFELFDQDKQNAAKTTLRPQWASSSVNSQIKHFHQSLDNIRQIQLESTVSSIHDEFNQNDRLINLAETSTPKKSNLNIETDPHAMEHSFENLEKEVNDQFEDDDETLLAAVTSPSDQSLASFRSAISTNDTNPPVTPDSSISS